MKVFPEFLKLQSLIERAPKIFQVQELGVTEAGGEKFPIYALKIGSPDKRAPTLGLFGGVHGLERIGSQCVLAFLESLVEQLSWDADLERRLEGVRLVTIPIVNPGGMYLGWRANPRGIDLMRNAPVDAKVDPAFLVGGHRLSKHLPWFRGEKGKPMELESQLLTDFVRENMFDSDAALALDVHSGFGLRDRLWYPYAKTTDEFPRLTDVESLRALLNRSYPNHIYMIEPQALNYTTHGDLWDYLFDAHVAHYPGRKAPPFIPWTLEMGSWIWVRKNPLQLFSIAGHYNPMKDHRYRRALRRHLNLFEFFLRAVKNYKAWA